MKHYMLLHYGFVTPTAEIMQAWGTWFATIADRTVDSGGHFRAAREISDAGVEELPLGPDAITGYTIIEAESLDEAEQLARTNPYIASIRVYEIQTMQGG